MNKYLLAISLFALAGCIASYEDSTCVKLTENVYGIIVPHANSIFNDMSRFLDVSHKKAAEVTLNSGSRYYSHMTEDEKGNYVPGSGYGNPVRQKYDLIIMTHEEKPERGALDATISANRIDTKKRCKQLS